MSLKEKLVLCGMVAATVIVALLAWGFIAPMIKSHSAPGSFTSGAAGNLLIEQYDPYVQQNGGINSALPVIFSGGSTLSGANTFSGASSFTSTATFGSSGSALSGLNFGNCSIASDATTITASSTLTADCGGGTLGKTALTGVTAADNVTVNQSTTTPKTFEGLEVRGASASSTAGFVTLLLYNGTGATFTWTAAASSSFQYTARR